MAATIATRLKLEIMRTVQRHTLSRFTVPTVGPGTSSPIYSLEVGTKRGILQVFRVHTPTGTDYTICVRVIEGTVPLDYSVYEILRVEGIDLKAYQETELGIVYSNDQDPAVPKNWHDNTTTATQNLPNPSGEQPLLFFQIHNMGGTPTGVVTLELVIESAD